MIDIHCHILPQVDDGPDSWDVAAEMCHLAAQDGITHIVATPHANDKFAYHREQHTASLERLRVLTKGVVGLSLGCDFHFSYDNLQVLLSDPKRYTIGDSNYLLVELSDFSIPPRFRSNLEELIGMGMRPVITHPERNPILQKHPEEVLNWIDGGAMVQVTASSVTGFWGRVARKVAHWLLKHDAVHVLATDAHDTKHRPPQLSAGRDAVAELCGAEIADAIVRQNPEAIIHGKELPYYPAPSPNS